jgi:hypothetical protein
VVVLVSKLPCRVVSITADRRVDPAAPRTRSPTDEGDIAPLERAVANEVLEPVIGLLRAGHDEQARRIAVEPVHDAGAVLLPTPGPSGETVDERTARVAGRRMNDDTGRLVDDEQLIVLVGDPELHLFRNEYLLWLRRQLHV